MAKVVVKKGCSIAHKGAKYKPGDTVDLPDCLVQFHARNVDVLPEEGEGESTEDPPEEGEGEPTEDPPEGGGSEPTEDPLDLEDDESYV